MTFRSLVAVVSMVLCVLMMSAPTPSIGQTQTSKLKLWAPEDVRVVPEMNSSRDGFVNYIFWKDRDDAVSALVHAPDTLGWDVPGGAPASALSVPKSGGSYTGTIDRTITFRAKNNGTVGQTPSIRLEYNIINEEQYNNTIDVGASYTANEPIQLFFVNRELFPADTLDLGFTVRFTNGLVDSGGTFLVGLEDFEGFHMWRGIQRDGSDLIVLGEMSKQEAFDGEIVDSLYFSEIIPELRRTGRYVFPGPVAGLGNEIDIRGLHPNGRLDADEFVWFDTNAFNGFEYWYLITTYDRGYTVRTSQQGLVKFDHCEVAQGVAYDCPKELVIMKNVVTPQDDLQRIYVVPNPYRSGSTQYTTPNYHNFPDNKLRFVNVPANCAVKIYTPAGDLVWWISNTDGSGTLEWDTRNAAGDEVASGVYIYRVSVASVAAGEKADTSNSVYGRIVIIR